MTHVGGRQGRVLALLALTPQRIVSVGEIVAAAWSGEPPATARRQVHTSLWQLRRVLAGHGGTDLLGRRGGGYRLEVDPEQVDLHRFAALVAEGRRLGAAGRFAEAAGRLRAATSLWSGPAFADLGGSVLEREAEHLEELRLSAIEDTVEYELAHRDDPALVAELVRLADEHPLRERIAGALMQALYRAGRQTEALQHYHRISVSLRDELGVRPGQQLSDRHAAILRQDPALLPASDADRFAPDLDPVPVPAQLPAAVPAFTGRSDELAALDGHARPSRGAAPIVLVSGAAGVGKTALVVHWAHRERTRFPDGQLYLDLRGYHAEQPLTAADALSHLLVGLGVQPQAVPADLRDRSARYRSELAGRRLLLVLDNASSMDQLRALMPGDPAVQVIVTSRDTLAGLVSVHGARRLGLGRLPVADAVDLLGVLVGERVRADPAAAAELTALCARLPLALRVAAELATSRDDEPLAVLVAELAGASDRLRLLDGGDPASAVEAVFSWSYRHLPPDAAHLFRLAGLHPGPWLDAHAAAAMTGLTPDRAGHLLAALARANLVDQVRSATGAVPRAYAMHDLLRVYAGELARRTDPAPHRDAAAERLLDHGLASAGAAIAELFPAEADLRPPPVRPVVDPLPLEHPRDAAAWLHAERPLLTSLARYAAEHGHGAHAVGLSRTLFPYLSASHHNDAFSIHAAARDSSRRADDRTGEGCALLGLGIAEIRAGSRDRGRARDNFSRALALFRQIGDRDLAATARRYLGAAETLLGEYALAEHHQTAARDHYRSAADTIGEARALVQLGVIATRLGHYPAAREHLDRAGRLFDTAGHAPGGATVANAAGLVDQKQLRFAAALDQHLRALHAFRELGHPVGEAAALTDLGSAHTGLGDPGAAIADHRAALALGTMIGCRDSQVWALNGLGEATTADGAPGAALAHHVGARALAIAMRDPEQHARAEAGLGRARTALGDERAATAHYRTAYVLYRSLGQPEADDVRTAFRDLLGAAGPTGAATR